MSNNFLGVGGNSALSKTSTDGILNLLQLSLLGNNAGVNVNTSAVPTSTITSLNSGIVPNSNNIMTAKANFYPQNVAPNLGGLGGVGNIQQSIMSQPVRVLITNFKNFYSTQKNTTNVGVKRL